MARGCRRGQAGQLGNGETSARFNLSPGNLRRDFKEGKNPHAPPPSPSEKKAGGGTYWRLRQRLGDGHTHRQTHSILLAALPSPSTCRLPACLLLPLAWHRPFRVLPAQDCPGRRELRAGIQMRNYSAGGRWVMSSHRGCSGTPPSQGLENWGLKEGGGAVEGDSCLRMGRVGQQHGELDPFIEESPSQVERGLARVSFSEEPKGPCALLKSPWLGLLGLWQLPGALPHPCLTPATPPTTTWMDPWLLPDHGCQLKLLNEAFAKPVPCFDTFRGSRWPMK